MDVSSATPAYVLETLMEGNRRFARGESRHPHSDISRVKAISEHQKPMAAILGCADSRAPAEFVLDQGFGDLFVCRVAGNFATPEQVASLEYAVLALHVGVHSSVLIIYFALIRLCLTSLANIIYVLFVLFGSVRSCSTLFPTNLLVIFNQVHTYRCFWFCL